MQIIDSKNNIEMRLFYNFYGITFIRLNFNEQHLLKSIDFVKEGDVEKSKPSHKNHGYFIRILDNFFSSKGYKIDFDLLDTKGLSRFYIDVYNALLTTSVGQLITYKDLSIISGHPGAYRAVGSAMAKNRWPILIPCHRVKSVKSIGGYSSGIELKKRLIEIERKSSQIYYS